MSSQSEQSPKGSWEVPRLKTKKILPSYTKDEIRERIIKNELLVVIDGYVLKLNNMIKHHPGGELALYHAIGKDASDEMHAMHPDWVFEGRADKYIVAKYLKQDESKSFVEDIPLPYSKPTPADKYMYGDQKFDYPAIRADYYSLFEKLRKEGLFECDYSNYAIEISRWLLFVVGMFSFILIGEPSTLKCFASALCTAALWHQAVFTAHDLGHSAVTANRSLDTFMGILLGDFIGGLSVGWWKKSHNVHHIVTNQPENDSDIQHLPFFAISPIFYEGNLFSTYYNRQLVFDQFCKAIVVLQDKMYYIIMLFGRFNLYVLSWQHVLLDSDSMNPVIEATCLSLFWVWYGWLLSHLPSKKLMFLHFFVSNAFTAILHIQITLSHFGMPVHSPDPENECFAARQIRTSLDVICPSFLDWFHGGLQFQIEHHLFPRLPRHNLRLVRPHVIELCKKHNLVYCEDYFLGANIFTIKKLNETAQMIKSMIIAEQKL
ncbi:Delta(8)-fatty-acid desaturase [Smittium mucronatum]|uniref:Delta(8)-fatty-acid desaturase n=1 Tax=Smittium mucronatum TaxID=133383 RepID=A0A1R0GLK5_9FUNG|nr:Delta(8)-fatty-acid desaturase [Smittium mucronatum]